ncbi:ribonuclease P protein component 4 [Haloquadratum walsbyi]|uniref:Ribonuclease P protein component 4 n=1 Tax=Haloquadratum walsbyi J07HQW2 TaxID=1238425 RepID=U1NCM4_9EURY|nr:RNase P subunit RPR2 [Haloquadratum walsbyi]ERG94685.1 MAG: RNase P subunit RPR2 [Haloquadratum walsbyi J07HQW2]
MDIPAERIERLHALAREAMATGKKARARSYVQLAKRIGERNRISLPHQFRRFSCDSCDIYLRPGKTARVRLQPGRVVIRCLECGSTKRYPHE